MIQFRSLQNKGFESVITTLIFIAVVTLIFLGVYYVHATLTQMRARATDEVNLHVVTEMARNRLFFCYGEHLENLTIPCAVNEVGGYEIFQESYGVCNNESLKREGSFDTKNRIVYFVPVFNYEFNRTCLGKIVIYI